MPCRGALKESAANEPSRNKASLGATGFARNLRFFAEPFEIRIGLSLGLIGVFADLRHGWILTCRLNVDNKAHTVGRPNNPLLREGRLNKNSDDKTGGD